MTPLFQVKIEEIKNYRILINAPTADEARIKANHKLNTNRMSNVTIENAYRKTTDVKRAEND